MNKSLKRLKKLIIIIMAVILLIIISLLILLNANKNNVQNRNVLQLNEEEFVEDIDYEPDTNIKKVTDRIQYYRIKDIIDRYCEQMNIINTLSQADLDAESKEKMISVIIDMLSNEYITQFSITSDTILNEANKYQESNYIINSMYKLELSQNIKVFIVQLEMNTDTNTNFLIAVDYNNNTFKIYGNDYVRKYNYDKDMGKLNDLNIESIEQNEYNQLSNIRVTEEEMAINYFNYYKNKSLHNTKEAYNLLDEDYRNKRFGNINEYMKYINENKDRIEGITIEQYLVNQEEDYTEYVCKDQYDNLYIFKEQAIMDYTVELDTYTIATDEFKKEYANGTDNKKVIMNVDKFIQMLNNYDYKTAYGLLNNAFKQNNFETEEDFKKYIQNTYYEHNDISIDKISDENGTYVCEATISNKQNSEENKKINIIMKLGTGINFEMSFEII